MRRKAVALSILLLVLLVSVQTVSAQKSKSSDDRSLRWERFDAILDNFDTAANAFDVNELYTILIERGPFSFGTREIPLDRIGGIEVLQVIDGGTPLRSSCGGGTGTYCVTRSGNKLALKYYFTSAANSGTRRNLSFKYSVTGALRSYPDGDQLWWTAVPSDRPFPADASRVTVTPATNMAPIQKVATNPEGWRQNTSGNILVFDSPGSLGKNGSVEIRIQYPHDASMSPPTWQDNFDRRQAIQPAIDLGVAAVGLLLLIGGPLFVLVLYMTKGRDPKVAVVPEYLSEPPSDDPPGVVGTLVDEKADLQDIMATLVDLARRGHIVIEHTKSGGIGGIFETNDFVFHHTDQGDDLRGYERELLRAVFGGSSTRNLSDMRNKFYTYIPSLKRKLYESIVEAGYFTQSPETTRGSWGCMGGALLIVAGAFFAGIIFIEEIDSISPMMICPAISLVITAVVALIAANYMPAKTAKGSQETAKWRAFRNYLANIKKYAPDLSQAQEQFDKYIGYAVAFGLDKQFIRQVSGALTSMPDWYYPGYMWHQPWHPGYRYPRHGQPGYGSNDPMVGSGDFQDLSGGQGGFDLGGGLNNMSNDLSQGLNSMSDGLSTMLNDASKVFTSQPSSSGSSSGGGGWSGGGSSGGSSGGGSAGFG